MHHLQQAHTTDCLHCIHNVVYRGRSLSKCRRAEYRTVKMTYYTGRMPSVVRRYAERSQCCKESMSTFYWTQKWVPTPQALPTLFLFLCLGLLSDFQSTKAFLFHNRLSLNSAHRPNTVFSTIVPCPIFNLCPN